MRNRHGPCPACGGRDRFRFDNKRGRGDYFCGQCGAGDGFGLLQKVHGWQFSEARQRVLQAAGFDGATASLPAVTRTIAAPEAPAARPTSRVVQLLRGSCRVSDCADAVNYLDSRSLWPLAEACSLKAHVTAENFDQGRRVGRFPAVLAEVRDISGELVTLHVTYLEDGKKLAQYEPRKILSPMTGREGCAVRLVPSTAELGIAEGVETALSAMALDGCPVWAALNTSLLASFEPPPGVTRLRIYADRDEAGLSAALRLAQRLQGRIAFAVHVPNAPANDWNDVLMSQRNSNQGSR